TINPGTLCAIEWHFFPIHGEKILPEKFTQFFKEVAKTPDHRIVATNGMFGLACINNINNDDCNKRYANQKYNQCHHDFQGGKPKTLELLRHHDLHPQLPEE